MDTAHRKIELQAPADLAYLESNVRLAARQKIDRDLPASAAPEGEDKLRRRVEELVDEVCHSAHSSKPAYRDQKASKHFTISEPAKTGHRYMHTQNKLANVYKPLGFLVHPHHLHRRKTKPHHQRPRRGRRNRKGAAASRN